MKPERDSVKPSCLFRVLHFFLDKLALGGIEAAEGCFDATPTSPSVHSPREREEYERCKSLMVMEVLRFVGVLLKFHPSEAFSVRHIHAYIHVQMSCNGTSLEGHALLK